MDGGRCINLINKFAHYRLININKYQYFLDAQLKIIINYIFFSLKFLSIQKIDYRHYYHILN